MLRLIASNDLAKRWKIAPRRIDSLAGFHPGHVWHVRSFAIGKSRANLVVTNSATAYSALLPALGTLKMNEVLPLITARIKDALILQGADPAAVQDDLAEVEWVDFPRPDLMDCVSAQLMSIVQLLKNPDPHPGAFTALEGLLQRMPCPLLNGRTPTDYFASMARTGKVSPVKRRSGEPPEVLRIRIDLIFVEPPIWRLTEVPADWTLKDLHPVIQYAMGWENDHLFRFIVGDNEVIHEPGESPDRMMGSRGLGPKIRACFAAQSQRRMWYEYDFGDSWIHELSLLGITTAEPGVVYPRCIDGARACPPEDSGGPYIYMDKLAMLADDPDEDDGYAAEIREWFGDFDPEAFSLKKTSKSLESMSRGRRERDH